MQQYDQFVDKFKPRHTSDDTHTPPNVYEAVLAWCERRYGIDRAKVLRPFFPGGDYATADYPAGCVVIGNRKPIATIHRWDSQRMGLTRAIRGELAKGHQAYIVYPLVEENEKLKYKAVEQGFLDAQRSFGPEYRVAMVHGRMRSKDKDAAMQRFVQNEAQVLVATTVIEVGVNVPNASVMVIENAERFGLSQLHQLRGRVGRGAEQSYCILVTSDKLSSDTRQRIDVMCRTTDGFEIAEADLRLRGPGDLEGTQQSGLAFDLKIASLAKDGMILETARNWAKQIVEADPMLESQPNGILRRRMQTLFAGKVDWSMIS